MDSNSRPNEGVRKMPLAKELAKFGYIDVLTYKNELLYLSNSEKNLSASSLFFVDAGYRVDDIYIFALSSPLHELKGMVLQYRKLMDSSLASKF